MYKRIIGAPKSTNSPSCSLVGSARSLDLIIGENRLNGSFIIKLKTSPVELRVLGFVFGDLEERGAIPPIEMKSLRGIN